jgi:hypothetical protein
MAEQVRPPYGDIFFPTTPTLDRLAQQMYVEQKTRQAKQDQENAMLDANIQKELGKVRSVDTPDVINSYNQYKQLKKQLLFDKKLQKDPLAYNQLQQAANQAYQNIFTTSNKSAELKEMQKQLVAERMKNPNAYADDAGQRISTLMATPISGVSQDPNFGDLTNWDNYRYQGSNTDFGKILKDAIGQSTQKYTDSKVLDGGLQTQLTPWMYGNTPAQVRDYMLGSMAMHQTGRDAAYQWDHTPEQEIADTIKAYQALPKEYWQRQGLNGPQDLLPKNPDNKAENLSSLMAMKYAIANQPKEGTPVFIDNKQAVLNWQFNKDKIMEGIRHGNRVAEIALRKEMENNTDEEQNDKMDELYDNLKADALKNRKVYRPAGGQPYDQYTIKASEGVKRLFAAKDSKGHDIYPDEIRFSKDFNEATPIFLEHYVDDKGNRTSEIVKNKKGEAEVMKDLSKPILEPEFKERWKKEIMGAGAYGKTLKGGGKTKAPKFPLPAGKPRVVQQGGYTYTWSEDTGTYE